MDISFSERFENIAKLTEALISCGTPVAQARPDAQSAEGEVLNQSSTKADYDSLIKKLVLSIQPPPETDDHEELQSTSDGFFNLEGPTIGAYEFATFHQDGQTSTVFKAQDTCATAPEKVVALKVTTPSQLTAPHNSEREARILSKLSHAAIIPLLESFWQPGGRLVLAFPFLRQDLENLLRSGVITKGQTSLVFDALFDGLTYLHKNGIIHRDVKPSNILLRTMQGPVCLIDFGIAWSPNDPDSEPVESKITDVGTTCYRPPELLFGHRSYDDSLDMWAAGCVVAELVKAGHRPLFDAGPLGSELSLIKSMFMELGTPDDASWPSAKMYPDWGKMRFQHFSAKPWADVLPKASPAAVDFVRRTVCYESTRRLSALEASEHELRHELRRHAS